MSSKYRWRPIYIEPIVGSGERVVVGFAISDPSGKLEFVPTLSKDVADLVFKKKSKVFSKIINAIIEAIPFYADDDKSILSNWRPPFEGIFVAEERLTISENQEIAVHQALKLYSCFGSRYQTISAVSVDDEVDEVANKHWITQVIHECEIRNSDSRKLFNRKIESSESIRMPNITVGFQSDHLIANFSHLSSRTMGIKSKFVDLKIIKDALEKTQLTIPRKIEMIVSVPENFETYNLRKKRGKITQDTWDLVKEASDATEIPLIPVHSSFQAAEYLIGSV